MELESNTTLDTYLLFREDFIKRYSSALNISENKINDIISSKKQQSDDILLKKCSNGNIGFFKKMWNMYMEFLYDVR